MRRGQSLQTSGRLDDAATAYAELRAAAPRAFEGWHFGGMIALLKGQPDAAEQLLCRALELNRNSIATALGLGVARVAKGDSAGAEPVLREVTKKQPKLTDAWSYLALALETQRHYEEAIEVRRRIVVLTPNSAEAWSHLGTALSSLGKHTEALEAFDAALQRSPDDTRARLSRAMTMFKCHRAIDAAAEFAAIVARHPAEQFEARSCRLMALNYLDGVPREQVFAEHVDYGRAAGEPVNVRWSNSRDPNRRLRLAFLSPDLRQHSVSAFIEPLLPHLGRAEFDVLLYHDDAIVDAVSDRLRALGVVWRNFANQVNELVEATVKADAPDILVDLTGHAGTNRLRLFARRLAPVQITYLGYPNTTGVRAMDYRLVDAITDPEPEADAFATEKLVRFASCGWSYLPPVDAPDVTEPPCLASSSVTFGSFNNFPKVTDALLRVWARVLQCVPGSRLLIKSSAMEERAASEPVRQRLRAAGLHEERVQLLPRTPDTRSHLELYGRVDVALDTFPYHGTTTTCEALWMGVPVVTREGDRHAARVGVSLLRAVNHPEWIAADDDDYVRIAVELANDRERLKKIRHGLRDELRRSPLLDHAGQAQRFGAAVRACWAEWCARSG